MIRKISFLVFAAYLFSVIACTSNTSTGKKTETSTQEQTSTQETSKNEPRKMLSEEERKAYATKGKAIAKSTFVALSTNLKKAMKKGEVAGALKYCNTKASKIIDSLSNANNAIIRRTTNKVRNEHDAPDEKESKVLKLYQSAVKNGAPLTPHVSLNDDNTVSFFAPIKMKKVCLKCHGTVGKELSKTDFDLIKKLYPNDEATGYKEGDFRGMWSIKMK